MRIEELIIEGSVSQIHIAKGADGMYRLQVLPSKDTNHWLGCIFQRYHWSQWIRQVQHSWRDLFRPWYDKYADGMLILQLVHEHDTHSFRRCEQERKPTSFTSVVRQVSQKLASPLSLITQTKLLPVTSLLRSPSLGRCASLTLTRTIDSHSFSFPSQTRLNGFSTATSPLSSRSSLFSRPSR